MTPEERAAFLLEYIDLLVSERVDEPTGFRHVAPGQQDADDAMPPARGRASTGSSTSSARLNSWYTKGLDNGSHLRVQINAAESIPQLRGIIETFFLAPALVSAR